MKTLGVLLLTICSSQFILAHPGGHHTHETFMGEWAWLIIPCIAIAAIVWKFSKTKSSKTEN
ncbi:hypothetical protein FNB79_14685 [Formosa sediminum]|uniref:Uncharacterized protein n=1 Tax=Formosa sediminum TaxID=2594004 RepID=A0A516GUJ0_9FLAO|nr:hypothetical protein [Formosa sediminum]QDO95165.1 hypothetical protein FNB79_14685 [Formosa sediminum]